jgi:hypothetical protein
MNKNIVKHLASEAGFSINKNEIHSKWIEGIPINKEVSKLIKLTIESLLDDIEKWDTIHVEDGMVQRSHLGLEICREIKKKYGIK